MSEVVLGQAMAELRLHFVLIPFPARGHISPMMQLACKLASSGGIRITFVTSNSLLDVALGSCKECFDESVIRVIGLDKGSVEAWHWKSTGFVTLAEASFEMEGPLEELLRGLEREGNKIQCLVGDSFLALVQDIANRMGIPRAVLWTHSGCSAVPYLLIKDLKEHGFVPVDDAIARSGNILLQEMPGLERYTLADLPFSFHRMHPRELELRIATTGRVREAAYLLLNSFDEIEGEAIAQLRTMVPLTFAVGPLLPAKFFEELDEKRSKRAATAAAWKEDMSCLEWLDKQKPSSVVYISFGSLTNLSVEQMEELVMGIEASEVRFLWVIRPNLMEGSSEKLQEFLGKTKDDRGKGMIIEWAPQLQVLRHKSLAAFVTHCGWNSEAICSGVPLLAWPCFAEQNVTARYIMNVWNIGMAFESCMSTPGALVGKDEIKRLLRLAVASYEKFRMNAKKLKETARRASTSNMSLITFKKLLDQ